MKPRGRCPAPAAHRPAPCPPTVTPAAGLARPSGRTGPARHTCLWVTPAPARHIPPRRSRAARAPPGVTRAARAPQDTPGPSPPGGPSPPPGLRGSAPTPSRRLRPGGKAPRAQPWRRRTAAPGPRHDQARSALRQGQPAAPRTASRSANPATRPTGTAVSRQAEAAGCGAPSAARVRAADAGEGWVRAKPSDWHGPAIPKSLLSVVRRLRALSVRLPGRLLPHTPIPVSDDGREPP